MDRINSIEAKLERLVPSTLSEEAQTEMEDSIDVLAGLDGISHVSVKRFRPHPWWVGKLAVAMTAVAMLALLFHMRQAQPGDRVKAAVLDRLAMPDRSLELAVNSQDGVTAPSWELLKSVQMIDGRENDGLILPKDGSAPYYRYRYRVVDEEKVKDAESGEVITLRHPRQEVLTVPLMDF